MKSKFCRPTIPIFAMLVETNNFVTSKLFLHIRFGFVLRQFRCACLNFLMLKTNDDIFYKMSCFIAFYVIE